jgi:hypothetical protein
MDTLTEINANARVCRKEKDRSPDRPPAARSSSAGTRLSQTIAFSAEVVEARSRTCTYPSARPRGLPRRSPDDRSEP